MTDAAVVADAMIREVFGRAAERIARSGLAKGTYHLPSGAACAQGAITDASTLVGTREGLPDASVLRRACEQELWNVINADRPVYEHRTLVQWSDGSSRREVVRTLRALATEVVVS